MKAAFNLTFGFTTNVRAESFRQACAGANIGDEITLNPEWINRLEDHSVVHISSCDQFDIALAIILAERGNGELSNVTP